jgi:hypothetical protein
MEQSDAAACGVSWKAKGTSSQTYSQQADWTAASLFIMEVSDLVMGNQGPLHLSAVFPTR